MKNHCLSSIQNGVRNVVRNDSIEKCSACSQTSTEIWKFFKKRNLLQMNYSNRCPFNEIVLCMNSPTIFKCSSEGVQDKICSKSIIRMLHFFNDNEVNGWYVSEIVSFGSSISQLSRTNFRR
jgi:hypothetical protein